MVKHLLLACLALVFVTGCGNKPKADPNERLFISFLAAEPEELAIGQNWAGEVKVKNIGGAPMTIQRVELSSLEDFRIINEEDIEGATLRAGEERVIQVGAIGSAGSAASMHVYADADRGSPARVQLRVHDVIE